MYAMPPAAILAPEQLDAAFEPLGGGGPRRSLMAFASYQPAHGDIGGLFIGNTGRRARVSCIHAER